MLLAPEKPPSTDESRRQRRRVLVVVAGVLVLALAVYGLVALLSDGSETTVGPGPDAPVGPQEEVGPSGRDAVVGSGTITSDARQVAAFTGVVIAGEGRVVLSQGDQHSVTLRTDDNLLDLVTTEVRDSTLYIDVAAGVEDIDPTDGVRFTITAPLVDHIGITGAGAISMDGAVADSLSIEMGGAGTIDVTGLDATRLEVNGTGAGLMTVEGVVDSQEVTIDGTVGYQAGNLLSRTAVVETNTVSDVIVWVTEDLEVVQRGSGQFGYYGTPEVATQLTGVGAVRPLGDK